MSVTASIPLPHFILDVSHLYWIYYISNSWGKVFTELPFQKYTEILLDTQILPDMPDHDFTWGRSILPQHYVALVINWHTLHNMLKHSELWSLKVEIRTCSKEGHTLCHSCLLAMGKHNYSSGCCFHKEMAISGRTDHKSGFNSSQYVL